MKHTTNTVSNNINVDKRLILFLLIACTQTSNAQTRVEKTVGGNRTDTRVAIESERFNKDISKLVAKSYAPVVKALELMDEFNVETELEKTLARLRKDPQALPYLSTFYKELTKTSAKKHDDNGTNTGYTRWKIVYLMGVLDNQNAIDDLYSIVRDPIPDPELSGDVAYANEYRIRLRSLSSLERLKAVEPLQKIYAEGGPLSRAAAVNLFEMGIKVDGIKKIDGQKVIGLGDPKNFNIKEKDKLQAKDSPKSGQRDREKIIPNSKPRKKSKQ
jgi:hypothetical protein